MYVTVTKTHFALFNYGTLKVFPAMSLLDIVAWLTVLSFAITQLEICKKWLERVAKKVLRCPSLLLNLTVIFLVRPLMECNTRKISYYGDLWKLKGFIHFLEVDKTGCSTWQSVNFQNFSLKLAVCKSCLLQDSMFLIFFVMCKCAPEEETWWLCRRECFEQLLAKGYRSWN